MKRLFLRSSTKLTNLFLDLPRTKWEKTLITKIRNEKGDISTKLTEIGMNYKGILYTTVCQQIR